MGHIFCRLVDDDEKTNYENLSSDFLFPFPLAQQKNAHETFLKTCESIKMSLLVEIMRFKSSIFKEKRFIDALNSVTSGDLRNHSPSCKTRFVKCIAETALEEELFAIHHHRLTSPCFESLERWTFFGTNLKGQIIIINVECNRKGILGAMNNVNPYSNENTKITSISLSTPDRHPIEIENKNLMFVDWCPNVRPEKTIDCIFTLLEAVIVILNDDLT